MQGSITILLYFVSFLYHAMNLNENTTNKMAVNMLLTNDTNINDMVEYSDRTSI